jgi:hypothetical protein
MHFTLKELGARGVGGLEMVAVKEEDGPDFSRQVGRWVSPSIQLHFNMAPGGLEVGSVMLSTGWIPVLEMAYVAPVVIFSKLPKGGNNAQMPVKALAGYLSKLPNRDDHGYQDPKTNAYRVLPGALRNCQCRSLATSYELAMTWMGSLMG